MLFENMGAYTVAAASTFNGFQRPTVYYVMPGPAWLVEARVYGPDKNRRLGTLPPKSTPTPVPALSSLPGSQPGSGGRQQLVLS